MSEENPYEANSVVVVKDEGPVLRQPVSLWLFAVALTLTLVFAMKNALEEGFPWVSKETAFVVLFAGASQLPGLFVGYLRWKKTSRAIIPMLIVAYFVALTGLLTYMKFAFDGRADSINSAAHMHVFAFPIMHCILAACLYVVFGIFTAVTVAAVRLRSQ
ncbi:MAG: hypothetical protein AB8G99_23185 [Planctomycetaceae bacterium]